MAAPNQPTATTAQPPPDVPSDPAIGDRLGNYLRQFALWTRRGFAAKIDNGVAQPGLYLQESGVLGVPRVYHMTVTVNTGVPQIVLSQAPLGGGIAGGPATFDSGPAPLDSSLTTSIFSPNTGYGKSSVVNPVGTASTSYVMMGLAVTLPPIVAATALWTTFDGQISNSANNGECDGVICYGTGTPPNNGDPQTGTIVSSATRYKSTAANDYVPFSLTTLITGVSKGQTYWLDMALKAVGGGTATLTDVDASVAGLA
jgi:hypothetical protein